MYLPTRVWGTGLRGGTKAQPVPQPQLNLWIYPRVSPTRGNPYLYLFFSESIYSFNLSILDFSCTETTFLLPHTSQESLSLHSPSWMNSQKKIKPLGL